ncbi:MAG TPA: hypothetical protein VGJ69_15935 [Pyrinomonadaceae bacterium]
MARFSKVIQLLTVILVVAVVNVYVMGAPMRLTTDPKKADAPETTETSADLARAEIAANKAVTPVAVAAEKLPLAPNSKVDFNRIFSKTEITSRATTSHNFLNAKTAARDIFKAPPRTGTVPQTDTDSGGGGSRGAWIAVGIIAAVLTIAVIGLRHDRNQ